MVGTIAKQYGRSTHDKGNWLPYESQKGGRDQERKKGGWREVKMWEGRARLRGKKDGKGEKEEEWG